MQNEFKGLRHYIDIVESAHQETDEGFAQDLGNVAGQVAGAPVAAAQWVGNKIGQGVDAVKQTAQNFAQGAQQGYGQMTGGAGAKAPTTPEEIKAFQKANGLTPDGIIGPKTLAAMKAKGVTPPTAGQGAKKAPAAPATATAPAQTQTQQNMAAAGMAGQEMRTPAEIQASKDMLSANNAGNINAGLTPDDPRWKGPKPAGPATGADMDAMTAESAGYDEIQRLVSLIHYK